MLVHHNVAGGAWPQCRRRHVRIAPRPSCTRLCSRQVGIASASAAAGRPLLSALRAAAGEDAPGPAPRSEDASSSSSSDPAAAGDVDGPWSPEFIMDLVRQEAEEEELEYSAGLAGSLLDDPEGLYEYVDRAWAEGPRRVTTPLALMMEEETGQSTVGFHPAAANDIIGIGTWRLKDQIDPVIEFLVSRIEGCWREVLDTDLNLYPRELWKDRGWDLADSEDPQRELDGFSYADIPDPEEGAEGYPRLLLENRVYCSKVFRKLHVEVGIRQDELQVLHVVAYPRYSYDMPIFGLDLVMVGDRVTLAVADCCPTRRDLKLPAHYMETMAVLQKTFLGDTVLRGRRIPDWGKASFSPLAVCITPSDPEQLAAFAKYAVALHRAHMLMSLAAAPVVAGPGDRRQQERLLELLEGQKRFCDNQLTNKKTSRVLEAAFGQEWTEAYMNELMFDFDPSYEPPFFDDSYERLYTYFDENPEFGPIADEAYEMELEAEGDRAQEAIANAVMGNKVPRDKLVMAVDFLYKHDPTFQAAVNTLSAGQAQVLPAELLTDEIVKVLKLEPEELGKEASRRAQAES